MSVPDAIEVCRTGKENVNPSSLCLSSSNTLLCPSSLAMYLANAEAIKPNSSWRRIQHPINTMDELARARAQMDSIHKLINRENVYCTHRSVAWHEVRRDGHLLGLSLGDTLVFPRQVHAQDAEVCSAQIQGIEDTLFVPEFCTIRTRKQRLTTGVVQSRHGQLEKS